VTSCLSCLEQGRDQQSESSNQNLSEALALGSVEDHTPLAVLTTCTSCVESLAIRIGCVWNTRFSVPSDSKFVLAFRACVRCASPSTVDGAGSFYARLCVSAGIVSFLATVTILSVCWFSSCTTHKLHTPSTVSNGGTTGDLLDTRSTWGCWCSHGVIFPDRVGGFAISRAGSPFISILVSTIIVFNVSSDGGQYGLAI